jgi:hypothetical protein
MTARVALVVTGRLEFRGLRRALGRLFPGVMFHVAREILEGDLRDSTSTRVDPARNAREAAELAAGKDMQPAIDELVGHLAGNLCGRDAADFSVLVEDLELTNRGNESNVLRAVRESVDRHLAEIAGRPHAPRDLARRLQERASFHLFDPMVEAYFYDDPRALDAAQRGLGRSGHRMGDRDPERFEVDASADADYFGEVGECARHRRPRDRRCPWRGEPDWRGRHPKMYLKYLCREAPPNEFCSTYQETEGGANALAGLDWSLVLASPGSAPFLRAMVEDLADALGQPPEVRGWPATPTSTAPSALSSAPRARVLRNV